MMGARRSVLVLESESGSGGCPNEGERMTMPGKYFQVVGRAYRNPQSPSVDQPKWRIQPWERRFALCREAASDGNRDSRRYLLERHFLFYPPTTRSTGGLRSSDSFTR